MQPPARFTRLLGGSEELVQARIASESSWLDSQSQRMRELTAALRSELDGIRQAEAQREQAVIERIASLEGTVATHLATLGRELEEPMTRLIVTASETPRAAAEVIGELRKEISAISSATTRCWQSGSRSCRTWAPCSAPRNSP